MANRGAAALALRDGDRERLEGLLRVGGVGAGLAQRARIVLLSAEGLKKAEIAELTGASRVKVDRWRDRSAECGLAGLEDIKRPGRLRSLDHAVIRAFIDGWNERAPPFTWTKTAEQILKHAKLSEPSSSGH